MIKCNCDPDCTIYENAEIPPCTAFLSNANPFIKDGKLIFKNLNRLFFFIGTTPRCTSNEIGFSTVTTNIQVSLATFIIGLFISQVQLGDIPYHKNEVIHDDETINTFIHKSLQDPPALEEFDENFLTNLALVYSNGNAIMDPFNYTLNICKLNYYILLIISRIENNPGLFFVNNSFATEDCLNFFLASLHIHCPFEGPFKKQ